MGSLSQRRQPISNLRPGKLARHGVSLLFWMLLRASTQAIAVLFLARMLGATDYGQFVAIIAIASFVSPFIGVGLSNIILRNGARDPAHLAFYLSRAVVWWLLTLIPGVLLTCLLAVLLLPTGLPRTAAFTAICAELAANSFTELRARHRQAEHRINAFGAINAGLPLVRLAAMLLLFAAPVDHRTEAVLWAYAASSLVYVLFLWLPIQTRLPGESGNEPMSISRGLPFSLANFAIRLQSEFNKPVLAHLGFDMAGAYNVAQRANDMASMPLSALQESLWPRLYAQQDPKRELRRAGLLLLSLSIICSAGIWLVAPVLPHVLGDDFGKSASVMRNLALLPLFQSLRALLNFHAIHRGHMKLIGWAYALGAIASVGGVAILVPAHGMTGAVITSYVSEATMIVFLTAGTMRPIR